jgi:integrase
MALTDISIRTAKPKDRPYKIFDGGGLHIIVTPQGSKLWRLSYRFEGKFKTLALGTYPVVNLATARRAASEAKDRLQAGSDPSSEKRAKKEVQKLASASTFADVAEEWRAKIAKEGRAVTTLEKANWFIGLANEGFGGRPIGEITARDVLAVLRTLEKRGRHHSAIRMRSTLSRIFVYAVASGYAERDPASDVKGALATVPGKNRPAVTTKEGLAEVLRAIRNYNAGYPETRIAMLLQVHLFPRPGELRHMEWQEIDFDKAVWLIPAEKTKMRQPHAIPLSAQALALLEEAGGLKRSEKYVFPSVRTFARPMSEATMNAALRRMGFAKEEVCPHGFRSTASTLLNENGLWNADAIEAALAHRPNGKVRAAYMRGQFWDERVKMMQYWSDFLDSLA